MVSILMSQIFSKNLNSFKFKKSFFFVSGMDGAYKIQNSKIFFREITNNFLGRIISLQ